MDFAKNHFIFRSTIKFKHLSFLQKIYSSKVMTLENIQMKSSFSTCFWKFSAIFIFETGEVFLIRNYPYPIIVIMNNISQVIVKMIMIWKVLSLSLISIYQYKCFCDQWIWFYTFELCTMNINEDDMQISYEI